MSRILHVITALMTTQPPLHAQAVENNVRDVHEDAPKAATSLPLGLKSAPRSKAYRDLYYEAARSADGKTDQTKLKSLSKAACGEFDAYAVSKTDKFAALEEWDRENCRVLAGAACEKSEWVKARALLKTHVRETCVDGKRK